MNRILSPEQVLTYGSYMHVRIYVYMYVVCVRVYVYMHICMYVYMYSLVGWIKVALVGLGWFRWG